MLAKRHVRALIIATVAYVCVGQIGRILVAAGLRNLSENALTLAQIDVLHSYGAALDAALVMTAASAARGFGTFEGCLKYDPARIVRLQGIDEFNVADSNGVWAVSSERDVVGRRLADNPHTAPFLALLTNDLPYLSQPYRASVSHPEQMRKYLAVALPDRSGIVQVGYDACNTALDFETSFHHFLEDVSPSDDWLYFVISTAGRVLASGTGEVPDDARESGLDVSTFPTDPSETFEATIAGETCRCRAEKALGVWFVTAQPRRALRKMRIYSSLTQHLLLSIVFVIAACFYVSGERRRAALSALRARNEERLRSDLVMAKSIQRSALPAVFPPYPRDLTIDLFAQMEPARDVGGDFYDFHYVGRERLALLVADVSGKGVPAAMFMMKAKAVLHDLSMSVTDLGEAVAKANDILCEGNDADMFVTCWLGVLDETTGVLRYVNAGHNPPYVQRADGSMLVALDQVSGMFLGGMTGLKYRVHETRLLPGDLIFLYTDGVTEANNTLGQMFGEERLEEVLRGERGLGLERLLPQRAVLPSPEKVCRRVRGAVDGFAGKAAQFDDITMLALRYRGQPKTQRLTAPVELASLARFNAFAEQALDAAHCPAGAKADMLVALDEVATNVVSYSGGREMTLEVEVARDPSVVRLRVIDDGAPWNPLDHLDPDVTLSADDRAIGGLGILMVKKLMDDVSYVRRDGRNAFAFRKMI